MDERWYFSTDPETGDVEMTARFEGDEGVVGDARNVVHMGDVLIDPPGLTYDALRDAVAGVLIIREDRSFVIEGQPTEDTSLSVTDDELRTMFDRELLDSASIPQRPKT